MFQNSTMSLIYPSIQFYFAASTDFFFCPRHGIFLLSKAWYFFSRHLKFYNRCSWPLNSIEVGIPTPYTVEYLHITLQLACGSASADSTNHESCSITVCHIYWKKYLRESEPAQFKPVLFKGQLYLHAFPNWVLSQIPEVRDDGLFIFCCSIPSVRLYFLDQPR